MHVIFLRASELQESCDWSGKGTVIFFDSTMWLFISISVNDNTLSQVVSVHNNSRPQQQHQGKQLGRDNSDHGGHGLFLSHRGETINLNYFSLLLLSTSVNLFSIPFTKK